MKDRSSNKEKVEIAGKDNALRCPRAFHGNPRALDGNAEGMDGHFRA
jgi:hypothetical protein